MTAPELLDADIAAAWPARWAKANASRPGASKRRNNLRRQWRLHRELTAFVAANPTAGCANCAHYRPVPHDARKCCDLDSDFHGYMMTPPEHVCTRWKDAGQ